MSLRDKLARKSSLRRQSIPQNPFKVLLDAPKSIEENLRAMIEKTIEEAVANAHLLIEEKAQDILGELERDIREEISTTQWRIKGDKGDKGDFVAGPPGTSGIPGKDGYTPIKGVDYFDGKDGESIVGPKGEDGKDGSPDTPDQVIEKIHESKKLINRSKIEGFEEIIKALRINIRERMKDRGGMGNVQHERSGIGVSTTTFVTRYKIAGAGFALWVYYNGVLMPRGTDYTVGTDYKTLTLTFTPSDGSAIDVIYIRT